VVTSSKSVGSTKGVKSIPHPQIPANRQHINTSPPARPLHTPPLPPHTMHLGVVPILSLLLTPLVHSTFTPKDLLSAPRTGPALPNPNGTFAVYTQVSYSFENDTRSGGLYLIPIAVSKHIVDTVNDTEYAENAIHPLCIVNSPSASDPQWLGNSTLIYISPTKDGSELRTLDIDTLKSASVQTFDADISNLKVHRGEIYTRIAFSAKVNRKGEMVPRNETATPEVLVYDRLWVRHWDEWITPLKNSVFAATLIPASLSPDSQIDGLSSEGGFQLKGLRNMLSGIDIHDLESPIPPWGGTEDFSLSESHLAFVAKDPHLNPATNTASHVYIVSFDNPRYIFHDWD
jgi:pre-mRNA-splicing helicase BRR2